MSLKDSSELEYIVIHQLRGDKHALAFLRNTSHLIRERLFFEAKQEGQTTFYFNDKKYILNRMKDDSYEVVEDTGEDIHLEYLG